jgi:NAD+ synthase (glutamine-hydrolysing)
MSFRNIHAHGFVRLACAAPRLKVADPAFNGAETAAMLRRADESGAFLCLFPELGISAYAIDDLLQQGALLDAVEAALAALVAESRSLRCAAVVGAPLRVGGRLFNCAVAIHRGRILAAVPKTYLPNYREFYERRQFASGERADAVYIELCGQEVPFGTDILLTASDVPDLVVHMEICEDVWTPIPPSSFAALAGATVLLNLSASNVTIGKSDWRHALCKAHSGRCIAA